MTEYEGKIKALSAKLQAVNKWNNAKEKEIVLHMMTPYLQEVYASVSSIGYFLDSVNEDEELH